MGKKLITPYLMGFSLLLSLIASAASIDAAKQESNTYGVCTLVENPVDPIAPFGTVMAPDMSVTNYYRNTLGKDVNYKGRPVNIVEGPKHGAIEKLDGVYAYRANQDYLGGDQVTFEMNIEGNNVKIIHFITVQTLVSNDMYDDKEYCPRGAVWMLDL